MRWWDTRLLQEPDSLRSSMSNVMACWSRCVNGPISTSRDLRTYGLLYLALQRNPKSHSRPTELRLLAGVRKGLSAEWQRHMGSVETQKFTDMRSGYECSTTRVAHK